MSKQYDSNNIFAKILRGEIPNKTVLETDHALAFYDIHPQAPVHVLLIPKGPYVDFGHFVAEASPEEQLGFNAALAQLVATLDLPTGFRVIGNAGPDSNQEVPHFHLHLLGGRNLGPLLPA
ncbi:Histidine triad (HIT) protein [Ketogulonicigenium robustum]|uniref:Histidine triad (HIT) protein n=1 Tax=Ketogulonicigenium robustum TaxID=92947 RepID=A0A1W6P0D4_9RHOB|nr:HIT domain-containing protein [Ketogulonicigenium robustum]ARO14972.1 Histidine triad (HIT) protein [Ketogulonicigenium robustum]